MREQYSDEELRALIKDAERYRWLRDKELDAVESCWSGDSIYVCAISDDEVDAAMRGE